MKTYDILFTVATIGRKKRDAATMEACSHLEGVVLQITAQDYNQALAYARLIALDIF